MTIDDILCQNPDCHKLIYPVRKCAHCGWHPPETTVGTINWRTKMAGLLPKPMTQPIVTKRHIIFHHESAGVVAYDLRNGKQGWTYNVGLGETRCQSIIRLGNVIYPSLVNVSSIPNGRQKFLAINADDGHVMWVRELDAHSVSPMAKSGHRLFFTTPKKMGCIVEIHDEKQVFSPLIQLPLSNSNVHGQPISGGKYFFAFAQNQVTAVHMLEKKAHLLFRLPSTQVRHLAYHEGHLFILDNKKTIFVVSVSTGECVKTLDLERGASSPMYISGNRLYVGVKKKRVNDKRVYALRAYDLDTYETIWDDFITEGHVQALPVATDKLLFLGSLKGMCYAVDHRNGRMVWNNPIRIENQRIIGGPVVSGANLFFATREGLLTQVVWRTADSSLPDKTAEYYRGSGEYVLAGKVELIHQNYEDAAYDFVDAQEPYVAAQVFVTTGDWENAGTQFELAGQYEQAAIAFGEIGDYKLQGEMWMVAERYFEAAEAFARGQHYKQQGEALEELGHIAEAAEVYKIGGMFRQARKLYESRGDYVAVAETYLLQDPPFPKEAARTLLERKLYEEGASLFIAYNHIELAAEFLSHHGDRDGLIELWIQYGDFVNAAKVAEDYHRWEQAAELWEKAGEFKHAAELYETVGRLESAFFMYMKAIDPKNSLRIAVLRQDKGSILRLAANSGDWVGGAQALASSGFPKDAAEAYETAERWSDAALLFDQAGDQRAFSCWIKAGDRVSAAAFLKRIGNDSEAAKQYERAGEKKIAAEIYADIGENNDALRLYRELGIQKEALEIYAEQEAWQVVAILADELHEYERSAKACLILAEESMLTLQHHYYRAAAQAFERAAGYYEQATEKKSARKIADLWHQAETYYFKGVEDFHADRCKRERHRVLDWPIIIAKVTASNPLVETSFGRLDIVLQNVGFGSGFFVDIRLDTNDLFVGTRVGTTVKVTRELMHSASTHYHLNVKPNEGARGENVPLRLRLDYKLPNGTKHSELIEGTIPVRAKDTLSSSLFGQTAQAGTTNIIHVYDGGEAVIANGDYAAEGDINKGENIHTGDHVEINRSYLSEDVSHQVDISEPAHKDCPQCHMQVASEDHFCLECGFRF